MVVVHIYSTSMQQIMLVILSTLIQLNTIIKIYPFNQKLQVLDINIVFFSMILLSIIMNSYIIIALVLYCIWKEVAFSSPSAM